jgi:hypothetical protein
VQSINGEQAVQPELPNTTGELMTTEINVIIELDTTLEYSEDLLD